jgi:hypothetical protein
MRYIALNGSKNAERGAVVVCLKVLHPEESQKVKHVSKGSQRQSGLKARAPTTVAVRQQNFIMMATVQSRRI